jgi:DNA polymerase III delta prime subunit
VTRDLLETVSGWVQETKDLIANMPPKEILVRSERAEVKMDGLQHHRFERLLRACSARQPDGHRLNVYLYGAPGTGKTTAARNVAKALGLPFHCNGAISTKYELTGFIDANGVCHSPEFRKAWQNGGVYLYDEIDGSMSQAIVAFNAALANGVMAFPDGMIERHPDCVIIAAANTVNGATAEFTGRTKLDAASLDRFVFIEWGIDDKLEEAAAGGRADWLREVRRVRRVTAEKGIKVLISPRATIYGASLLAAGMGFDEVREMALRKGMNDAQWAMVA